MLLLIDNYDSFTYNLYQYLSELGASVEVARNDRITLEDIAEMAPEHPKEFGRHFGECVSSMASTGECPHDHHGH